MSKTWEYLGFRYSPYNADPLKPCNGDVDLLVGREDEMTELCSVIDTQEQGTVIISGPAGVGKTSFFNVTQYLLESSRTAIGSQMMCARFLCAVRHNDTELDLARRALSSLIRSVELYCAEALRPVPPETVKLSKWVGDQGSGGIQVGLTIAGFGGSAGRTVTVPKFGDSTFERVCDALECVVSEIRNDLGFAGTFIVLDNLENLEESKACDLLMSFRDTLFTCPGVWWVLIGQAGFGGVMQSINPRVYERIIGTPIELKPIGLTCLHAAIERRVSKFHVSEHGSAQAPLSKEFHEHLYNASNGEIRFVFKYSSDVCVKIIGGIVRSIILAHRSTSRHLTESEVYAALGRIMTRDQILTDRAESVLRAIISDELSSLQLKPKEVQILRLVGDHKEARSSDFKAFGLKTQQDFSSNYLAKMHRHNLLARSEAGRTVRYGLRGVAALAYEYSLLKRSLSRRHDGG